MYAIVCSGNAGSATPPAGNAGPPQVSVASMGVDGLEALPSAGPPKLPLVLCGVRAAETAASRALTGRRPRPARSKHHLDHRMRDELAIQIVELLARRGIHRRGDGQPIALL